MNNIFLNNNFIFRNYHFSKFHHTDNCKGSPKNYLAYMEKGMCTITSDTKTIKINEGDIFFIPINLCYQSYWYSQDNISFLSFGYTELGTDENINFELQAFRADKKTVEKIHTIPLGQNITSKALSLFYDVMADITPKLTRSKQNSDIETVRQIKKCIKSHPHLSLSDIANMCNISEPYLYMLFKKTAHSTPNDYRQKVLCKMGVELLTSTDKKVEEIAEMLKFSSASYFRKVLKKHTEKTPREIRKTSIF